MATTVGELNAILRLDKRNFDSGIGEAEGRFSRFGGAAKSLAKGVALGAGAAVAGAVVTGTKALFDFDTGLREVFTLMPGITEQARTAMQEDVLAFSKSAGIATGEVLPALYQAISKGVPADNVFEFMEIAGKAAIGGSVQLENAVDGITSVVNAYGSEILSATEASDLMFTSVRIGGHTFGELSDSLFNVTPTAAALGVKLGDVTGSIAQMTAAGIPASVATTQLRQLFVELSKDGGKAADAFQELSGKTFTDFIHSGRDVADALELMEEAAGNNGVALQDMFGSVEAGAAALALGGTNLGDFRDTLAENVLAAGATEKAWEEVEDGLQRWWNRITVNLQNWLLELGMEFEGWWKENGPGLVAAVKPHWDAIVKDFGFFVSGLGVLWQILTQDQETYTKEWEENVSGLARSTKKVWDKIVEEQGRTNDGMRILQQILTQDQETYTKEWEENVSGLARSTKRVWDSIVTELGKFAQRLAETWDTIVKVWDSVVVEAGKFAQRLAETWDTIVKVWDSVVVEFNKFAQRLKDTWNQISGTAETSGKVISTIWQWILGELSKFRERWNESWEKIGSGVRSAFTGVTDFVSRIINNVIGAARRGLNSAIDLINGAIRTYNRIPLVPDISSVPSIRGSGVGGKPNSNFARLHTGGRVPGPPGTDQMAILRAGETVGRSGLGDAPQWPSEMRLILGDDQGDDLAEFMMDRGVHLIRSSQGLTT